MPAERFLRSIFDMCGIIGCTGVKNAKEVLLSGLKTLEYRGYDSAGIACFDENGEFFIQKAAGKIRALEEKLSSAPAVISSCGIGHTRWATHGAPTDENSHPHGSARVQIVHNGIIENYAELREELIARGYRFSSETDTEAVALLLDKLSYEYPSHIDAIAALTRRLVGSYALGILFCDEPTSIYAVRRQSPLLIGVGEGESFLSSDLTAILAHTKNYLILEAGEIAILHNGGVSIINEDKTPVSRPCQRVDWDVEAVRLEGHAHFMHKEICEEPSALGATLSPRIASGLPDFSPDRLDPDRLKTAERIVFVACGTAYHAALIAKRAIEGLARVQVVCEIASEFRYRDPVLSPRDVVICVSQSGETADTLAALSLAKARGAYLIGVVNVVGSTLAREADAVLYTHAGPEIAVASTKAYTVQSALLSLFAVWLARLVGKCSAERAKALTESLTVGLPSAVREIISREDEIKALAAEIGKAEHLFFIGRGADADAAAEASLKLKEISYLHSEAYAAGELKHGTISLVEKDTPIVALSSDLTLREKMISNVKEVLARGAKVLAFSIGDREGALSEVSGSAVSLPETDAISAPIAMATALQLFAYHVAVFRGCEVDQPRNLAKSVTVE